MLFMLFWRERMLQVKKKKKKTSVNNSFYRLGFVLFFENGSCCSIVRFVSFCYLLKQLVQHVALFWWLHKENIKCKLCLCLLQWTLPAWRQWNTETNAIWGAIVCYCMGQLAKSVQYCSNYENDGGGERKDGQDSNSVYQDTVHLFYHYYDVQFSHYFAIRDKFWSFCKLCCC